MSILDIDAGTNCLTKAEDLLAAMIGQTATYQSWAGVTDQSHIYVDGAELPIEGDSYGPEDIDIIGNHVVIYTPGEEGFHYAHDATSHGAEFQPGGSIEVLFCEFVDRDFNLPGKVMRAFKNTFGNIIEELWPLAGIDENLNLTGAIEVLALSMAPEKQAYQYGETLEARVRFFWKDYGESF